MREPAQPAQFPFPETNSPNQPTTAPPPSQSPSAASQDASEAPDKLTELNPASRPLTKSRRSSIAPSKRPSVSSRNSQRRNQTWQGRGLSARGRQHSTLAAQSHAPISPTDLTSLSISHKEFNTHASVSPHDGRLHISVNRLSDGPVTRKLFTALNTTRANRNAPENDAAVIANIVDDEKRKHPQDVTTAPPKLNIVIMVIGSRGDVQPFIAVAKVLKEQWGHRVRLATHGIFREFVEAHGIELFDVGGDPSELMAFMVKNPGLIPNVETIKAGEIARRREQMFEMFQGFWRACILPNDRCQLPYTSAHASSSCSSSFSTSTVNPDDYEPFIADAIIANPPSFAHVHCAEKLGCPLHLMFTFPYSPTAEMPHPLAFIQNSNLSSDYTNALTYPMVEMMTWQGLGDLVNRFRQDTLFLEPVATLWAPGIISRLKVPFTYMWSSALIPKPKDWGNHIDITGFVFLDQTKDYEPPEELRRFLEKGETPIYIGFGSIVVDDPKKLTKIVLDAVKETGVRALVSAGWGGLGGSNNNDDDDGGGSGDGRNGDGDDEATPEIPENVFILTTDIPHDYLFTHVSAVIHHGGAGTTAISLLHGRPTLIIPFFGDQTFWGTMISHSGAGPPPIPYKDLTVPKLVSAIKTLLTPEVREKAAAIQERIQTDGDGAENAVRSFYKALGEIDVKGVRGLGYRGMVHGEGGPMGPGEGKWGVGAPGIRCDVLPEKYAVWRVRRTRVRLSCVAATWAVETGRIQWRDLRLLRQTEWNDFDGPGEPLSGGVSAFVALLASVAKGIVAVPKAIVRGVRDEFHDDNNDEWSDVSSSSFSSGDDDDDEDDDEDDNTTKKPNEESNKDNGVEPAVLQPGVDPKSKKERLKRGIRSLRPGKKRHATRELPRSVGRAVEAQGRVARGEGRREEGNGDEGQKEREKQNETTKDDKEEHNNGNTNAATKSSDTVDKSATNSPESSSKHHSSSPSSPSRKSHHRRSPRHSHPLLRSLLHLPIDIPLAIAQGYHNLPRLYHDPTVRHPARITGFHSGLRAAGKEFSLGIYDGVSGLYLQPYHGAQTEGFKGAVKGVLRGVAGLVVKPQAGVAGVVGYTVKGLHREAVKGRDRRVMGWVERERRRQGEREAEVGGRCREGWGRVEREVRERRGRRGGGGGGNARGVRESGVGEVGGRERREMRRRIFTSRSFIIHIAYSTATVTVTMTVTVAVTVAAATPDLLVLPSDNTSATLNRSSSSSPSP
ncbi:UDP-Glycosyltransferase/glycogen phosphorylase [Ascodesmis nigricans]|uniref:UDP-Glycosyltransferase/glycogen phosphorylase n=1 Tax=Ascodesmis nigricans TaxID=341454 RepID=A0A4S2MQI4_9PEZI|nr:UDP-Glycosyltransferase/glycogen phosphorylase [Ascodesmis nigricans]